MKKIVTIILALIIALAVVSLLKDEIIKSVVISSIEKSTGAKASIAGFSLSLLRQTSEIRGFKIYNPKGFAQGLLMDLPYVKVNLDAQALFKKELHLRELTIELQELDLVKNKQGQLNVDALKVSKEPANKKEQVAQKKEMPLTIDVLNLKIGRIVSKDYTQQGEPLVDVYDINIQKSYRNITSVNQLVLLVLTEPMKSAGIRGAKIYSLAALTGVGFVPVVVGATLFGKASGEETVDFNYSRVYDAALRVIKRSGTIKNESKETGVINAAVNGAAISIDITESDKKTRIKVSARKYFLPKPEIANGIIYRIKEELK